MILSAIALAAIIVIANLDRDGNEVERIVVAGPDAAARVEAIEQLGQAVGVDVEVVTTADDAAATAAVADGDADVAVSADGTSLTTEEELDLGDGSELSNLVNVLRADLALDNGLRAAGLSADEAAAVRASPPPDVGGDRDRSARRSRLTGAWPQRRSPTSCCSCCCRRMASGWSRR